MINNVAKALTAIMTLVNSQVDSINFRATFESMNQPQHFVLDKNFHEWINALQQMILTKVKAPELMQEGSKFLGRELILLFRPKLTAVPPLALMTGLSEFKQLPSFLKKFGKTSKASKIFFSHIIWYQLMSNDLEWR